MEQFLGMPPVASEHGVAVDKLIIIIHYLMFVLFIGWGIFYTYSLIRFRKSKNPVANYTGVKSHLSSYLEIAVALFEVVLLVAFSIPVWSNRVSDFPPENTATVVRVVAEQFAWNIHYPGPDGVFGKTSIDLISADNPLGLDREDPAAKDDITTINQLNVPVHKPVIVHLSSKDVIHSFNLPYIRSKQDAIPGLSIPLWFTPTKTTAELQQELAHKVNLLPFVEKTKTKEIPTEETISISGGSYDNYMVTQDVADAQGTALLSAGDILNKDNVKILTESNVTSVHARTLAKIDTYLSTQDYKDKEGNPIVSKGEPLTEDIVTKLMRAGVQNVVARPSAKLDTFISTEEYKDKTGNVVLEKGGFLDDLVIRQLVDAGINEIVITPSTPTEIACAQLCGLGHYRMRGYMTIMTQAEYDQWVAEQEASMNPPQEQPADSTTQSSEAPTNTENQ